MVKGRSHRDSSSQRRSRPDAGRPMRWRRARWESLWAELAARGGVGGPARGAGAGAGCGRARLLRRVRRSARGAAQVSAAVGGGTGLARQRGGGPGRSAPRVRAVEAGALEHHADTREELAKSTLAHRARGEGSVREGLLLVESMAAGGTGVGV